MKSTPESTKSHLRAILYACQTAVVPRRDFPYSRTKAVTTTSTQNEEADGNCASRRHSGVSRIGLRQALETLLISRPVLDLRPGLYGFILLRRRPTYTWAFVPKSSPCTRRRAATPSLLCKRCRGRKTCQRHTAKTRENPSLEHLPSTRYKPLQAERHKYKPATVARAHFPGASRRVQSSSETPGDWRRAGGRRRR